MQTNHKYVIIGAGSVFNLAGSPPNKVKIGDMSDDTRALRGDWAAVGNAISKAQKSVMERSSHKTAGKDVSKRASR